MISRPKTYADYVPPAEGKAYQISGNSDGTSKISDVTQYLSEGSNWGATDANAVWDALETVDETADETAGKFNADGVLPVQNGGTGAATAADALANLGALPLTGGTLSGNVVIEHEDKTNTHIEVKNSTGSIYLAINENDTIGNRGIYDGVSGKWPVVSQNNSNDWTFNGDVTGEVGSWSPSLLGTTTAGTPTYTMRTGRYIRLGKMVHVTGRVRISALSGATGNLQLGGLPFPTAANAASAYGWTGVIQTSTSPYFKFVSLSSSGNTAMNIYNQDNSSIDSSTISNFDVWNFSVVYITA